MFELTALTFTSGSLYVDNVFTKLEIESIRISQKISYNLL